MSVVGGVRRGGASPIAPSAATPSLAGLSWFSPSRLYYSYFHSPEQRQIHISLLVNVALFATSIAMISQYGEVLTAESTPLIPQPQPGQQPPTAILP